MPLYIVSGFQFWLQAKTQNLKMTHECYTEIYDKLPKSMQGELNARSSKKNSKILEESEAGLLIINNLFASYERKKARAKISAKNKRDTKVEKIVLSKTEDSFALSKTTEQSAVIVDDSFTQSKTEEVEELEEPEEPKEPEKPEEVEEVEKPEEPEEFEEPEEPEEQNNETIVSRHSCTLLPVYIKKNNS